MRKSVAYVVSILLFVLLLLLKAVRPHLDRSEVTYSRRAPTVNLPFWPAYSSSFAAHN